MRPRKLSRSETLTPVDFLRIRIVDEKTTPPRRSRFRCNARSTGCPNRRIIEQTRSIAPRCS